MTTIKRFWPYGSHGTVGNLLTGIGDIWRDLNSKGIPCFYKGADGYGPIFELLQVGDANGVENVAVWRTTLFDVPNWYAPSPEDAAVEHVAKVLSVLPPEFDKRVWLEIINEPDKDDDDNFPDWDTLEFSDWLGRFMIKAAEILLPQGFKLLGFGYSSGEPELEGDKALIADWETDSMLAYLRLCSINHESLGIALHEYSYKEQSFLGTDPWLIGRFTKLFEICDKHGIKRPKVAITEWGATLWKLPIPEVGLPEMEELANQFYAKHPEILGVAIWNFGEGWNDIRFLAQKYLAPMKAYQERYLLEVEETDPPDPPPVEPPPEEETFEQKLWKVSVERQISHGIQLAPTALQDAIRKDGLTPVHDEAYIGDFPPFMAAEDWTNRAKARRVYYWKDGLVHWFKDPGIYVPPEPPAPEPPPEPPPPSGNAIDLFPYFMPDQGMGLLFEVRFPAGNQQRVQHQRSGNELWITKGTGGINGLSEFEHLKLDDSWIWRGVDTSPGKGRFYHQYEQGKLFARWCKRWMRIGETFVGSGHLVQFYMKGSCSPSSENSGPSTNIIKLAAHHSSKNWFGVEVQDVIELHGSNGEIWYFAKGIGNVGWESPWDQSFISELHNPGSRPNNQREPLCNYTLP